MSAPQNRPHTLRPGRQICIWLLTLALAFQSVSAAVIGVTGGQHRHIACAPAEPEPEPEPAPDPTEGLFKALLHQLLGDGAMAILEARQALAHAASASPQPASDFPVVWTGGIPDDLGADGAAATAIGQPMQAQAACPMHPEHTHSGYERHKHTHGDATPTVHVGQAENSGGGDDASLIHAELPPALEATPLVLQIAFAPADRQAWPVHQQAQPRSWRPAPQERPPRA